MAKWTPNTFDRWSGTTQCLRSSGKVAKGETRSGEGGPGFGWLFEFARTSQESNPD